MKTLKLFNGVLSKNSNSDNYISEDGFIIESNAMWAIDSIVGYYKSEKLDGNDLNKTFHKSWATIKNSSRYELMLEQITHYITTYGSNFSEEMYIPSEVLNIPDLKLKYTVIKGYTKDELIKKCLSILQSGIALKEETINDILSILIDELDYTITGDEGIRNKEAIIKIADMYGVFPKENIEFFRYIIYKATGESLLIKDKKTISLIKDSNINPSVLFKNHGLEKLAEIFNRYKPLFLAFKNKCPKTINKISKLSKKYHEPLTVNPLNLVTSKLLTSKETHWLDNATPFALFKALQSCHTRVNGQDTFVYRIRNGKSYVKENSVSDVNELNLEYLYNYLHNRYDFSDIKIYFPENVIYALPTSEKMFVGNVPTGTQFSGEQLAVGVYWENSWGANDLDLSGLNISGKIGWNSNYKNTDASLMYSGDIVDAPNGAVEYLYASHGLNEPTLISCNVYSGDQNSGYKIIIGKGNGITDEYMLDPNNLFLDVKTQAVQKQNILGILIPNENIQKQTFVLLNFGSGQATVSSNNKISNLSTKALFQQWNNVISFNNIMKKLGATIVTDPKDCDYNFSLGELQKDSFTKLFNVNIGKTVPN